MTEPLSLAALIRARAKHLIIAGDPCQLGPILATPATVTVSGKADHVACGLRPALWHNEFDVHRSPSRNGGQPPWV